MTKECFIVIHKKKGLKTLISKLVYLQQYQGTSGIQKGRNPRVGKGINLAGLAQLLEEGFSWVQKTAFYKPAIKGKKFSGGYNVDRDEVIIPRGKRMEVPARPFISVFKIPAMWEQVKEYARALVKGYLNPNVKRKQAYCKQLFKLLANFVATKQKERIGSPDLQPNAPLTIMLKNGDIPLEETGRLRYSITGKSEKRKGGRWGQFGKEKAIKQIDKIITDINKYVGKGKLV